MEVQFLLHAADEAATDYYVRSLGFNNVWDGMLFWFPSSLVNVFSQSGFYQDCREDLYKSCNGIIDVPSDEAS